MTQEVVKENRPSVVPVADIPLASATDGGELSVRPFAAHGVIGSIMPASGVALSWTQAKPGQDVQQRSHTLPGLLIILGGSARLLGGTPRDVQQGDVITLPAHHAYAFSAVGAEGLSALHVTFGEEAAQGSDAASTVEQVLSRNTQRAHSIINNNPFFRMLREGDLSSVKKRAMMRECLRVFSDSFQTFLFARQALCREDAYRETFMEHLREELGHNLLLKVAGDPKAAKDPILNATSTWFCHQMLTLDNAGKVALNIMLETAGYYFHILSKPVFGTDESAEYFDVHEADEQHKEIGLEFLGSLHPARYPELQRIVDEGWDKLDAMTRRVAHLVEQDAKAS